MDIRDNFDTIKDKAVEVASTAVKKTKQLALISKANLEIISLQDKIKKAQLELGKLYYRDYAVDEEHDIAEYLPWCKKIDEAKRTIAELRDYIEDLKCSETEGTDEDIVDVEEFVEVKEDTE